MAAAQALDGGGVIGFPTDTVYGLACSPRDLGAVERLYQIKSRPAHQPLILMAASVAEIKLFSNWTLAADDLSQRFWPGPLTLIVRATTAGEACRGAGTLGVRIPAHQVALELLRRSGPLATTSANRHGGSPATDAMAAVRNLPGLSGALADGATLPRTAAPSSILDLTGETPVLLRQGELGTRELGVDVPG
ncbi:MAG: L-threonylcarbamoyladenylate synthase [Candidatus Dormiibacterota bacterium]